MAHRFPSWGAAGECATSTALCHPRQMREDSQNRSRPSRGVRLHGHATAAGLLLAALILITAGCGDESPAGSAEGGLSNAMSTCRDYGTSQGLDDEALTVGMATTLGDIRAAAAADGSAPLLPEPWASRADSTVVARCSFTLPPPTEVTPTTLCADGSTDFVEAESTVSQVLVDDQGKLIAEEPLPAREPCGT